MGIATFGWLREQMTQTQRSIVHGAADADGHEIGRRVRTAPLAFTICRRFQPALSISISNSRGGMNLLHAAQPK
jgi:hypothetical protein